MHRTYQVAFLFVHGSTRNASVQPSEETKSDIGDPHESAELRNKASDDTAEKIMLLKEIGNCFEYSGG